LRHTDETSRGKDTQLMELLNKVDVIKDDVITKSNRIETLELELQQARSSSSMKVDGSSGLNEIRNLYEALERRFEELE
jgi:uncharacterized protein YoxC